MVKFGLVGLGFMGAMHIRALDKVNGASLTAICNPSGRRLDGNLSDVSGNIGGQSELQLDMSKIAAFKDYEELLESDIDVVDICSPTHTHKELVIKALQKGKHVLCEKPLCRDSAAAREIVKVAKDSEGQLMPAMCLRFWPEWRYAHRLVKSKEFGEVKAARLRRVAEPPAWGQGTYFDGKLSGGGLFDLHVHDTDFVQFLFGKPNKVYSQGYTKYSGAIDHVLTQYSVECGAAVSAEGSWTMTPGFGFNMEYTIQFEKATLDYDFSRTEKPLLLFKEGGEQHTISFSGHDGYANELQYLTDVITSNGSLETVTAEDGLNAVLICEAEEKSAFEGRVVDVA